MIRVEIWILSVFLLLISFANMQGQSKPYAHVNKRSFNKAVSYAEAHNFPKAIILFKEILEESPEFIEGYLHLGLCYLNTNVSADTAVVVLEQGLAQIPDEEKNSELGVEIQMTLAKAYQVILESDQAIEVYNAILKDVGDLYPELVKEIEREKRMCEHAKVFLANPIELEISNLGKDINSKYDDHSPLVSAIEDLLIFTSRRGAGRLSKLKDGQYPEKIFYSSKKDDWDKAKSLKQFFRNIEHESALSLSADGKELFIYRNDEDGKSVYMSRYVGEEWQEPEKLPYPINSEFNETHASLSADKSTLYFTSDRPGGYGGMDIYSIRKKSGGEWGDAVNLGSKVNTPFDEETAMIHPDGYTLYFASEGHNSMGRMDVFYTQMQADSSWLSPVNLGYPINTPDDDFFFLPTVNKSEAYYASARFNDNFGGSDVYKVEFDQAFEGELAVIEAEVLDKDGLGEGSVHIMVTRKKDERLVGDYRPDEKTGRYTMFLETGHEYRIEEKKANELKRTSELQVKEEMAFTPEEPIYSFEEIRMEPPMQQLIAMKAFEVENKEIEDMIVEEMKNIKEDTYYTIQILALKYKPLFAFVHLKGLRLDDIQTYKCIDGYTRYIYGVYNNKESAMMAREKLMHQDKYKDSFVRSLEDVEDLKIK